MKRITQPGFVAKLYSDDEMNYGLVGLYIPAAGEICCIVDGLGVTVDYKIGNGVTPLKDLPFVKGPRFIPVNPNDHALCGKVISEDRLHAVLEEAL